MMAAPVRPTPGRRRDITGRPGRLPPDVNNDERRISTNWGTSQPSSDRSSSGANGKPPMWSYTHWAGVLYALAWGS